METIEGFKPYDLLENRVLNISQISLIVMDGTLQSSNYPGLSPDEGFDVIRIVNRDKASTSSKSNFL